MPRPKVKPQDRQRSAKACAPCKRSKIRCDGAQPCVTCKRRSREDECEYDPTPSPSLSRRRRPSHCHATPAASAIASPGSWDQESLPPQRQQQPLPPNQGGALSQSGDNEDASADEDDSVSPKSRMLLSSKLQKVYIGETASLSYLQFLRNIVRHSVGGCAFTENEFSNYMLETGTNTAGTETPATLEPRDREALIRSYLQATSGVLDFYDRSEILVAMSRPDDTQIPQAALLLITAIGAQSRGTELNDLYLASSFFAKGQALAFQGMLCDPSVDMVVQFLLLAFYLLGACHRNAAYMYLGVASKAAIALGLHRLEQYRGLPPDERRLRLKSWKSLRVLDSIYNSILGRIGSVQGTRHDERQLKRLVDMKSPGAPPREAALDAVYSICPFLDELEHRGSDQSTASLERFLLRLQQWSKALPEELRCYPDSPHPGITTEDNELYLGAAHVACVYYFTVLLATRRYLTMHLLPKVRKHGVSARDGQDSAAVLGLAQVCLNAAVSLAKVGHHALLSGNMPNNMCLMKAWMFAAGLLLCFALFAEPPGTDSEVEEAFENTRSVLKYLAALSPLAGHYHDILTAFLEATSRHHRRRSEDRRRTASRYMDSIFTTSNSLPDGVAENASTDGSYPSNATLYMNDPTLFDISDLGMTNTNGNHQQSAANLGLEDFSFDWQPFAPFFDDYG